MAASILETRRSKSLNSTENAVTSIATIRNPFDMLAEGLLVSSSRGDKTWLELFFAGLRSWNGSIKGDSPEGNEEK